jgi:cyclopropane fatty-acyl-phospholipid synthase-like methyltransferase
MAGADIDEQRLAFGRVAELYDRARPSYPPEAIDGLLDFADMRAGAQVLELGAGTGKATRLLAERGLLITALEPDAAMASVARRNCAAHANVEIEQAAFEAWRPTRPVQAVVSAQAWHWIEPAARYRLAAAALADRGCLAAIWTFPEWATMPLCDALQAAYAQAAPNLAPDFPMHPASEPTRLAGDWTGEIERSARFTEAQILTYSWAARYSAAEYCDLLETHQDHILLAPAERSRLLSAITEVIQSAGEIEVDFVTLVCLARLA